MTPVFVSPFHWAELDPAVRNIIQEVARRGEAILATPSDGETTDEESIQTRSIGLNRPLELQKDTDWLTDLNAPVLIALHSSVEPVTISRRYPCAWIEPGRAAGGGSRGVALARRCGLVVTTDRLRQSLFVDTERFLDVDQTSPDEIHERLQDLKVIEENRTLHAILVAELFRRDDLVLKLAPNLNIASEIKHARLKARLSTTEEPDRPDYAAIATRAKESGDPVTYAVSAMAHLKNQDGALDDSTDETIETDGLPRELRALVEVLQSQSITDAAANLDSYPASVQSAFLARVSRLEWSDFDLDEETLRLLSSIIRQPGNESIPTVALVSLLAVMPETEERVLTRIAESGRPSAALAARLELLLSKHQRGEQVLVDDFDDIIDSVDQAATHPALWKSGLDYWIQMTGSAWLPGQVDEAPPWESAQGELPSDESSEIAEADAAARLALRAGDIEKAAQLFGRLRVLCLSDDPPATTTEQAARLNLGWALWKLGKDRSEWGPCITSVIEEVRPATDYLEVRQKTVESKSLGKSP